MACTTVIVSPGTRTSKNDAADALMMRSRTRSPSSNSPVQPSSGGRPFTRYV
jgi:hypothetical protein